MLLNYNVKPLVVEVSEDDVPGVHLSEPVALIAAMLKEGFGEGCFEIQCL